MQCPDCMGTGESFPMVTCRRCEGYGEVASLDGDYKGFVVNRDGGPDAPWRAWHPEGIKYRADTLEGLLGLIDADRGDA